MKELMPFGVAFETEGHGGHIKFVRVVLSSDVMDAQETVNVALCEHPLYPYLARYVAGNPPRAKVPNRIP